MPFLAFLPTDCLILTEAMGHISVGRSAEWVLITKCSFDPAPDMEDCSCVGFIANEAKSPSGDAANVFLANWEANCLWTSEHICSRRHQEHRYAQGRFTSFATTATTMIS